MYLVIVAGVECLQAESNAGWMEEDAQTAEWGMLKRLIPTEHWSQDEQYSSRLMI